MADDRPRDRAIACVILIILALVLRLGLERPDRWHSPDEGLYAGLAAFTHDAGVPWSETLPAGSSRPLHMAVYALADGLSGHDGGYPLRTIAALHALLVGASACLVHALTGILLGVTSPWARLGAGAAHVVLVSVLYEGQTCNSEHMVMPLALAALLVWTIGWRRESLALRCAAFAFVGAAVQTKPQVAPLVLCAPWWWALTGRPGGARGFAREMAGSAAAFLVVAGLITLATASSAAVSGNSIQMQYTFLGRSHEARLPWIYERMWNHLALVPVMFVATTVAVGTLAPRSLLGLEPDELRPLRIVAAPFLLLLLAAAAGVHLFSHYFLNPLPFGVLLAAGLIARLRAVGAPPRLLAAVSVIAMALAGPPHYLGLARREAPDDLALAAWIRERTAPADPIFFWGWTPQLYPLCGRPPASRYASCSYVVLDYDVPGLPPYDPVGVATLLSDLERRPPRLIVVPRVQRYAFDGERYALSRCPPFADYLARTCGPPLDVGGNLVFMRR